MATTKKQASSPDATPSTIDRVLADSAAVLEAAEGILWKLDGAAPTTAERNVIRLAGIIDSLDFERECGRIDAVKKLMSRAGTRDEYLEAQRDVIKAAQAENERRPGLEERLNEIQAELTALEQARLSTARKASELEAVRQQLRGLSVLPAFVRDAYETERLRIHQNPDGARLRELSSTITMIDALQRIDLGTQEGMEEAKRHCETAAPHLITRKTSNTDGAQNQQTTETLRAKDFEDYRNNRLKNERPKLQSELDELRAKQSDALAQLEGQLNYYLDRI